MDTEERRELKLLDLAHNMYPSFRWNAHHFYIAEHLEKLVKGEITRLMLFLPPQCGKSTLSSQCLPSFYLMNYPTHKIILASYDSDLAQGHSEQAMRIVKEWGWLTGVSLGNRQAKSWWNTNKGGQMIANSIMGKITGCAADLFLIDDPVKGDEAANSPTIRKKLLQEYNAVCESRMPSRICITQTRWHPSDLSGQLLQLQEQGGQKWHVVSLPALAETNDPLGRSEGESIWETRYPREHYENMKKQLELQGMSYQWHSLYQQSPIAGNQALEWQSDYFAPHIWYTPETKPNTPLTCKVLACDPSRGSDSKASDYQAFVLLEYLADGTCLVESWMKRMDVEQMLDFFCSLIQQHQPQGAVIETGGGQDYYGQRLQERSKKLGITLPIYCFANQMNKVVRIRQGLTPYLAQRKFKFLKSNSNAIGVGQMKEFSSSQYDDFCDALDLALQLKNKLLYGTRCPPNSVLTLA